MRLLMLSVAVMASLTSLYGCTSNPNSPAIQAMDNPPNACGSGGSANIGDCDSRR